MIATVIAGTSKTTTLSVIRAAAESHGYAVEGLAATSRAARQLGEAGVETGTLQGFLARGASRDARIWSSGSTSPNRASMPRW